MRPWVTEPGDTEWGWLFIGERRNPGAASGDYSTHMALEVGLVGLPNAGKSTLFNALTEAGAAAAPYPFTTVDPNVGVVPVPEARLQLVGERTGQERRVLPTLEAVDIAGLVEGAHRGEGLGNQFLARIREVDVIAQVVRCFSDPDVAHPVGKIDPADDIRTVDRELCAKDLESVSARLERELPIAKSGDPRAREHVKTLEALAAALSEGLGAGTVQRAGLEDVRDELFLLTEKPALIVANVSESALPDGGEEIVPVRGILEQRGDSRTLVVVAAQIESELAELEAEEAGMFRDELGLEVGALDRIVRAAFDALDLVVFFTADGPEARAWTTPRGTPIAEAVAQIHTDFLQGFIRAEVLAYSDLEELDSIADAKHAGRVRTVGRDYPVEDGDLVHVMV
jgi:GTP-binding protein YchF